VTAEDLFTALDKALPDKLLADRAKTIDGSMIRLQSAFRDLGSTILGVDTETSKFIEGGLGDRFVKGMQSFRDALADPRLKQGISDVVSGLLRMMERARVLAGEVGDYLLPKLQVFWNTIQEKLTPVLTRLWKEVLEPLAPVIGTVLVVAIGLAIDVANVLITVISTLSQFLLDNKAVVLVLATAYSILKGRMLMTSAIAAFTTAMNAAKGAMVTAKGAAIALNATLVGFTGFTVIGAAAAASAVQVWRLISASRELNRLQGEISNQQSAHGAGTTAYYESLKRGVAAGRFSQEEANRRMREYNANFESFTGRHAGGPVSAGQAYVVGERQPEVFQPNTQGRVMPSSRADEPGKVTNILSGTFNLNTREAVDAMWERLDKNQRLAGLGMS
jgi:hypothetical protein